MLNAQWITRRRLLGGAAAVTTILVGIFFFWPRSPGAAGSLEQQRDLIIGLPRKVEALDIDNIVTIEDYEVMAKLHLGLVTLDSRGRIYPAVASSWTVQNDGLEFIFRLRNDLSYPDGRRVTCIDALNTFEYLRGRKDAIGYSALPLIASMKCISERDFVVRLKQQSPYFLVELADLRYAIRRDSSDHLAGLGPYRVIEAYRRSGRLRLRRHEQHPFLTPQSPDTIDFRVVENFDEAKRLLASGGLHLYPLRGRRTEESSTVIDSNQRNRIWMLVLSKNYFRQDTAAACLTKRVDRRGILNGIDDKSFVETSTIVPVSPAALQSSPESRETCRRVASRPLRFIYMDHFDPKITGSVIDELTRLGFRFRQKTPVPKEAFLQRLGEADYDVALFSAGVSAASPVADLTSYYARSSGFPPSQWNDVLTSHMAEELNKARSELEVRDLTMTLVSRTLRKGPLVPLFFETERYLAGRCIQVGDYETFRSNQQFSSVSRLRGCL
ncbi:MAG: hypothetical protein KF799_13445 [Bdellovibrionales bacterium]|nr:hypothetical protein [Bdellovibrionales bacterium]